MSDRVTINATVNGEACAVAVEPRMLLVELLREQLGLTATHAGCENTSCGACAVLLDGRPVKSCTVLAVQVQGRAVVTVEGLATAAGPSAVETGFAEEHALHCGYCTPGMMITATALLADLPQPTEDDIRKAISGNRCRCTGYVNIVKAIEYAAEHSDAHT